MVWSGGGVNRPKLQLATQLYVLMYYNSILLCYAYYHIFVREIKSWLNHELYYNNLYKNQ